MNMASAESEISLVDIDLEKYTTEELEQLQTRMADELLGVSWVKASIEIIAGMATTRIIPMHINKGKSIVQCLKEQTECAFQK